MTPLHLACRKNSLDIVKYLVELGANIEEKNIQGITPLHLACKYNALDTVKFFMEYRNVNIEIQD